MIVMEGIMIVHFEVRQITDLKGCFVISGIAMLRVNMSEDSRKAMS
jgi:hypothetical protein